MEKWIILWMNGLDYPCCMPEDDGEGMASFPSIEDAQAAWNAYHMSQMTSAWAFDIINGDSMAL